MKVRKIRSKPSFADEVDEEDEDSRAATLQKSVAQRKAAKDRKTEKKKLLSFDDEEAPVSEKKKGTKLKPDLKHLTLGTGAPSSTQRSGAGEYTAERMKELQRNTIKLPPSQAAAPAPVAEPAFKLSGSFKATKVPKDDGRFEAAAAATVALRKPAPAPDNDMPLPPPVRLRGTGRATASTASVVDDDRDGFQAPDEETIRKIKERRARLQGAHMAPDYIPLGAGGVTGGLSSLADNGKAAGSQGSGSDSEPEQDGMLRMTFLGDTKQRGKAGPGVFASLAEAEQAAANDPDEEELWAAEQIRKGMGAKDAVAMAAARNRNAAGGTGYSQAGGVDSSSMAEQQYMAASMPMTAGGGYGGRLSQPEQITAAGVEVVKSLQQGVAHLQASHKNAQKQLQRTSNNLAHSMKAVEQLEQDLQAAGDKYQKLQELKAYIADLCDMLQAKSPIIEELQDHLLGLQAERAAAAADVAAADDREEEGPAEAAVQAALSILSRGGADAAAAAAAQAAADEAVSAMVANLPTKLDEFGRDENMAVRDNIQRRVKQRQQRYQKQQAKRKLASTAEAAPEDQCGDDTTDESDSEVRHYQRRRAEVLEASVTVFSDAAEQFGTLEAVTQHVEQWKAHMPKEYADAYMSVSLPAVLAPFVRLQLLQWDPLFGSSTGFDGQQWYRQLFDYGLPPDGQPSADDPDADLIPRLVQDLVVPLARHALQHAWNPHSRKRTAAAVAVMEEMHVYVDAGSTQLQELHGQVQDRLAAAVCALKLPFWPPAAATAAPGASLLLARRYGKALRLLSNIAAFDHLLPRSFLLDLALTKLTNHQLVPYLRSSAGNVALAVHRASRLVKHLPQQWFSAGPAKGAETLVEFLHAMARALEVQHKRASRDPTLCKTLAGLLTKLGNAQRAQELLLSHGLQ